MSTQSSDRSELDINWASQEVAERRSRGHARRAQLMGPATELMLDLADVRAGSRVLDVAAGTGDQTLFAARRVGANGYVSATDVSASMLEIAQFQREWKKHREKGVLTMLTFGPPLQPGPAVIAGAT